MDYEKIPLKEKLKIGGLFAAIGAAMWSVAKFVNFMQHRDKVYAEAHRGFLRDAYKLDRMLKEKHCEQIAGQDYTPPDSVSIGGRNIPVSPREWADAISSEQQNSTSKGR